jgi:protein gp37
MPTKIEWVKNADGTKGETWNPISGCSPISAGCKNCYARRMSKRLAGRFGYPPAPHNFDVTFHPGKLNRPLHWKKPRRIFVCSMSDLFHPLVDSRDRHKVFCVMEMCRRHTFQILTKRPEIMAQFIRLYAKFNLWPLSNVWLGITGEDQEQLDKRVPVLLQIPAAVRFVSIEPMLGNIFLHHAWLYDYVYDRRIGTFLDWIIAGAETGPGKRPMKLDWARSVRDQCQQAGVPFFFKRDGEGRHTLDGRLWEEMPDALRAS